MSDPQQKGWIIAEALSSATGGDLAGKIESSFVAEGIDPCYAGAFIQDGIEAITGALKIGGVTNMIDRPSNSAKIKAFEQSEHLKDLFCSLFGKFQDDIISGEFFKTKMKDWTNGDANLLMLK